MIIHHVSFAASIQTRSNVSVCRDVAQPGSAHAWGACGRRFKSSRPDQFSPYLSIVNRLKTLEFIPRASSE